MEAITRQRVIGSFVVMLAGYALSLALLGAAAGFDHGATKWLIAASLSALALGMLASVALRVAVLVLDPRGREVWWARATRAGRVWRAGFFVIRVAMAIFVWSLAARAL